jgi:tRNA(Ser,Leu) C12 N-acetylase TAN1
MIRAWSNLAKGWSAGGSDVKWNVVATVRAGALVHARSLLQRFGRVFPTDYFNVLVMRVPDVQAFVEDYAEHARADAGLAASVARVAPSFETFDFSSSQDFETKSRRAATGFAPQLAGKSFHVRMNRRGFKKRLPGQAEEQRLDRVLLGELRRLGARGCIAFDDPDAILDIETVGERAGVSLWTRDDLARVPLL